jgi:predicted GNAT family acetyltransferase
VELVFHRAAGAFRRKAAALLAGGEVENPLLFGILAGMRSGDGTRLCTLQRRGRALAAAVQTPVRPLVLAKAEVGALAALAREWDRRGLPLNGVFGPAESAQRFAAAWPGERLECVLTMRSYALTRVVSPNVPGALRAAAAGEVPLLTAWARAFIAESGGHPGDPAQIIPDGVRDQRLFVWEVSAERPPVAMAAWTGRTSTSARLTLVYTPPELRGRGYASACVAAVSQRLLDEGLERCLLFADLANPTSNAIYQRLGYVPLGDFAEYRSA